MDFFANLVFNGWVHLEAENGGSFYRIDHQESSLGSTLGSHVGHKLYHKTTQFWGPFLEAQNCQTCVMMAFPRSNFGGRFGVRSISIVRVFKCKGIGKMHFFAQIRFSMGGSIWRLKMEALFIGLTARSHL